MSSARIIAAITVALLTSSPAQRPQRPIKPFNGEDLSGWEGDTSRWSVADGVITGTGVATDGGAPSRDELLIYKAGLVDDFELTFKARLIGDGGGGVLYRNQISDAPESEISGYRLAIEPQPGRIGMLDQPGGRGILALRGTTIRLRPGGQRQVLGTVDATTPIDPIQWNEYSIIARGSRLLHKINGELTCSAVDDDAEQRSLSGSLALQLPSAAAPGRIEVKDLVLRRYNRAHPTTPREPGGKTALAAQAVPEWIWSADAPRPGESVYFRRPWKQEQAVESATLSIAADEAFTVFLNGDEIGRSGAGQAAQHLDITPHIRTAFNHLAVRATDSGGEAGIVARVAIEQADGSTFHLVTDRLWTAQTAAAEPQGWKTMPGSRRDWQPCRVVGQMGIEPWGELLAPPPAETPAALGTPPGYRIDQIYAVPPETQGSWTALAATGDGRLFAGAQDGGIYAITLPAGQAAPKVETLDLPIGQANGLLWAFDSLYVCVNGERSGLYRITDKDGDGKLDTVSTLKRFEGNGDRGPHGIAAGPSPLSIYIVSGEQTELPDQLSRRRPPSHWGEDQLLPVPVTSGDGALPYRAWTCMTRARGREWELHSIGLRNPYDIAFNHHGDLFTCDGDSPSELGTPFFRPASLYHVPMGADLGARGRGRNFPHEYPDTLPPVIELDPGSPTGLTFGYGAAFPTRFQKALYVCDWSRSSIDAIHLVPEGATYRGEREAFVSGPDLHVTDIAIASDGAMYFTTGGRGKASGLWRVRYTGDEDTAPVARQPLAPDLARKHSLLQRLGNLQSVENPQVIVTAWPSLRDSDRFIRYAARTAIEHHAPDRWLGRYGSEKDANAILELSIALARSGTPEHQSAVIDKLASLDFKQLNPMQKIAFLRAHGLAFIRLAPPSRDQSAALIAQLTSHFPSEETALDLELSRMLIYLQAPGSIETSLRLLDRSGVDPSASAYASFLASAKHDWTAEEKTNYLAWFDSVDSHPYSPSTRRFLGQIRAEFLREKATESHE